MSTSDNNNNRSTTFTNRLLNGLTNTYFHSDSIVENETTQSSTWVDSLNHFNHLFSSRLFRLPYIIIDIVLLGLAFYYGTKTCPISHALPIISICILALSGLELFFTLLFFVRNWSQRHIVFTHETGYKKGYRICNVLHFLRFICICISTGFVFASKLRINKDCEIFRFYLVIVCFNTWILFFIWLPNPSLPRRRSLMVDSCLFLIRIIYYGLYFGFVIFAMMKTEAAECKYTHLDDLHFRAPLKSFAHVGLILTGCIVGTNMLNAIVNQLFSRRGNLRRISIKLSAIHYMLTYLITIATVYYFSVGIVLLFPPRSGSLCRETAPNLYKTLLIWQLIRVILPFILWPLAFLVCCVGIIFGACLAVYLPASITVPFVEALRERFPNFRGETNPNPPASPGTIEALPIVVFGQVTDEFNQTECAICRCDYEANEQVKKLPCNHVFHASCVATWLSTTRICPVCRARVTSASL